ncbi:MAG: HEAT repeat domain-containing protein [Verrucomicrobiales bacterium]|nr:HEAT repeat domain-containing protein [Verrucomicrobiales bacterium]
MAKLTAMLLLVASALTGISEDRVPVTSWERAKDMLGLLPETNSPYGAAGADYLEEQIGRKLSGEERSLLARDASGKWKTFSDDLVSFDIPDDPLLTVEVFVPKQEPQLQVVGGAVGTTDNSFAKVYRITFGDGVPYGLVLVTDKPWFDEGICLCGPIALKTFAQFDGNIIELSQLPSGAIKKFQAINDSHRAILFEWTHSAITQNAYFRIGASLRLRPSSDRSREEWIAFSKEHRGFDAGLGWLRPGTAVADVIDLLGKPARQSEKDLVYANDERTEDGRGWRSTFTLPISRGHLQRFGAEWSTYKELKAPRGTNAWIEDTLRAWSDEADELSEGESPSLPAKDVEFILGLFHKKAGASTGSEWGFWCDIIADLARLGIKDKSAAKLVSSRRTEMDLPQFQARWVLELYELPERTKFVQDRLAFLTGDSEGAATYRGECHNLFASLEPKTEVSRNLILRGTTHDSDEVREAAVFFASKLHPEESLTVVRSALSDPKEGVRWYGILNVDDVCTKKDLQWLQKALQAETNERNRKELEEKIGQLE